jgi:hypothetical protein
MLQILNQSLEKALDNSINLLSNFFPLLRHLSLEMPQMTRDTYCK